MANDYIHGFSPFSLPWTPHRKPEPAIALCSVEVKPGQNATALALGNGDVYLVDTYETDHDFCRDNFQIRQTKLEAGDVALLEKVKELKRLNSETQRWNAERERLVQEASKHAEKSTKAEYAAGDALSNWVKAIEQRDEIIKNL